MSREYDEYCHTCLEDTARSESLQKGYKLFQCLRCGGCWYEVTIVRRLRNQGTNEATWTNAVNEACENIDYRCEDG